MFHCKSTVLLNIFGSGLSVAFLLFKWYTSCGTDSKWTVTAPVYKTKKNLALEESRC